MTVDSRQYVKPGDKVRLTYEGIVSKVNRPNGIDGTISQVTLGHLMPTDHRLDRVATVEIIEPSLQEKFDALPIGGTFSIVHRATTWHSCCVKFSATQYIVAGEELEGSQTTMLYRFAKLQDQYYRIEVSK